MISLLVASLLFKGITTTLRRYAQAKELVVIALYLVIVLVSGIYSTDKENWLNWVRIKLPFFALPLAFAPIARLSNNNFIKVLYAFMLTFFVSTAIILVNYFLHFQQMTESFRYGTQIPMPYSHIRYTLMLAFSFFCAVYLVIEKQQLSNSVLERNLQIAYAAFAFIAIHILSVRSSLLALYVCLLFVALSEIIKRRRFLLGAVLIALIIAAPFAAICLVPSLHNKIDYMRYDLGQYKQGDVNQKSDGMRLLSMQMGLTIWQQHPVLGIGAGDLETEMNKIYAEKYPQITNRLPPHNQFIWVLATTGVVGLSLFLLAFFYPVVVQKHYQYGLFVVLNLVVFSSFFTEDTFEEQMGSAFYLIFLLLLMNHLKRE